MNDDPDLSRPAGEPVHFEASLGGRSRIPAVVGAVTVAFLAFVVVKPWVLAALAAGEPVAVVTGPSSAPAAEPHAVGPASSSSASERAVEAICLDPGTWRTATIEQWHPDQTVRVWRAVEPRQASGPTDPGIERVPAVGETIPAIGFCAPAVGPDRPGGPATVDAWRVTGDVATPVELRLMAPIGAVSELGALFAPPLDATTVGWPDGVYVFRYTVVASQLARWFAVEVRIQGTAGPAAPPSPSAVMQPGGGLGAFFLP